ncbi:MAG: 2-oxoacid:acceptor oxidoreductase, partial [Nitrospinota bacterium]|nr:2-oxoacid:acceptor oxidoreductase [Nitrospinota bacterium]
MGAMSHVLKIFKAGEQVDSNGRRYKFSRDDLHVLARIYNPIFHEAPLVIGHPTTNAPAYGWAKALRVEGDTLEALVDG